MRPYRQHPRARLLLSQTVVSLLLVVLSFSLPVYAQDESAKVAQKLQGFDAYMERVLKDWNAPGIGVGIVVNDKLVFAKGYGYRDYEKKLPITSTTLFPIASNTKLFTAVAAGFLVEVGKLTWNRPIRE
ncbi:MAG TPA: serine hydrolase domain-containing protein, partial [Pyrinomonadaceae bacterium]|nr:serine hydrolase domain-containing protein [Pyrinomonadaceae bacterium]